MEGERGIEKKIKEKEICKMKCVGADFWQQIISFARKKGFSINLKAQHHP
jgi:hypothetical protein